MIDKKLTITGAQRTSGPIEVEFVLKLWVENDKLYNDAKVLYKILRTKIPAKTYDYLKKLINEKND